MFITQGIIVILAVIFWFKYKKDLKNNIDKFIGLAFLSLLALWISYKTNKDNIELKKSMVVTNGNMQDVTYFPRGSGLYIHFNFLANGKRFINKERLFAPKEDIRFVKKILIDRKLIVVFDSINPENNKLLLTEFDFKDFNILKPDSLKYIYYQLDSLKKFK